MSQRPFSAKSGPLEGQQLTLDLASHEEVSLTLLWLTADASGGVSMEASHAREGLLAESGVGDGLDPRGADQVRLVLRRPRGAWGPGVSALRRPAQHT